MREPIAVSYIRFSSKKQEKGDSIRRQTVMINQYAKDNDLYIDQNLSEKDEGVSAYRGSHRKNGFGRILDNIKKGEIISGDYILIESFDRFSREDVIDSLSQLLNLLNTGVKLVTVSNKEIYSKENSNTLMMILTSSMHLQKGHTESADKGRRLLESWQSKREKLVNGTSTKILTSRGPVWLEAKKDKTGFKKITERVKIVKEIFDLCDSGIGARTTTMILNERNVKPFGKSKFWQKSSIDKILTASAVTGDFELSKMDYENNVRRRVKTGEIIKDYYPQIISHDYFERIQDKRRKRITSKSYGQNKGNNLFSGLLRCDNCKESMQYVDKAKDKYSKYLRCRGVQHKSGCKGKNWRYDKVENLVLELMNELPIQDLLPADNQVEVLLSIETDITNCKNKLLELDRKQKKHLDLFEISEDLPGAMLDRIKVNDIEIKKEKSKLNLLEIDHITTKQNIESGSDNVKNLKKLLSDAESDVESRTLIRLSINDRLRDIVSSIDFKTNVFNVSEDKVDRRGKKIQPIHLMYVKLKNGVEYTCSIETMKASKSQFSEEEMKNPDAVIDKIKDTLHDTVTYKSENDSQSDPEKSIAENTWRMQLRKMKEPIK